MMTGSLLLAAGACVGWVGSNRGRATRRSAFAGRAALC
jgi:hypothetical protein